MKIVKIIIGIFLLLLASKYYFIISFPYCLGDPMFNPIDKIKNIAIMSVVIYCIYQAIIILLIFPSSKNGLTAKNKENRKNISIITGILLIFFSVYSYMYNYDCSQNPEDAFNNYKWIIELQLLI